MNTTRERLKRILAAAPKDADAGDILGQMADRLLAAGATLPEPSAPLKVWPGTDAMRDAHRLSSEARAVSQWFALTPEDYSAIAAAGWRALVASLPGLDVVRIGEGIVSRAALAALADPYDGGVT